MYVCIDINTTETDSPNTVNVNELSTPTNVMTANGSQIDSSDSNCTNTPTRSRSIMPATSSRKVEILEKELEILEVSDECHTVRVQLKIRMSWYDDNMSAQTASSPSSPPEGPSWTPELQFGSVCPIVGPPVVTGNDYTCEKSNPLANTRGLVTCERKIVVTLDTTLDHFCFPFDRQMFEITIRCKGVDSTTGKLGRAPSFETPTGDNMYLTSKTQEWHGAFGQLSCLDNEIHIVACVERMPYYYLINIVLILSLITAMAAYPFWIDHEDLSSRLGLNFTLVLTAVAFKYTLSSHLPRIPYLTYLDFYVLSNFGYIIACGLEHVIASNLGDEDADELDDAFLWVAGITWLFVHIVLIVLGACGWLRAEWSPKAKYHMKGDFCAAQKGGTVSTGVDKIDGSSV